MPDKYGSHADYMDWVKDDADSRQEAIEDALRKAFFNFIEKREAEVIVFSSEVKESVENAVRMLLSTLGVSKK